MKAERRKAWTDALRSGKYKQGHGRLRTKQDEFCCLGVLCDITNTENWDLLGNEYSYSKGNTLLLPFLLREEIGGDYIQSILMYANDGKERYEENPQSFDQIADLIESIVPTDEETKEDK